MQLKEFCANRGMKWQFTMPLATHQNGCSQSMMKNVKCKLKNAIEDAVLTPFQLYTCLLEATNLVNQRPIGRVPNDPDDGAYLCPDDILLGRESNTVPQRPFDHTENPRHRFASVRRLWTLSGRNGLEMSSLSLCPEGSEMCETKCSRQ